MHFGHRKAEGTVPSQLGREQPIIHADIQGHAAPLTYILLLPVKRLFCFIESSTVGHIYSSSTWETEVKESEVYHHTELHGKFEASLYLLKEDLFLF